MSRLWEQGSFFLKYLSEHDLKQLNSLELGKNTLKTVVCENKLNIWKRARYCLTLLKVAAPDGKDF